MVTSNNNHPRANYERKACQYENNSRKESAKIKNPFKAKSKVFIKKAINLNWKLIFIFLISLKFNYSFAQLCPNCDKKNILNPTLDITVFPLPNLGQFAFQNGKVLPWEASFNSPHQTKIIAENDFQCECNWFLNQNTGEIRDCILAANFFDSNPNVQIWKNYTEGIHQAVNFISNNYFSYCIDYDIDRFHCTGTPGSPGWLNYPPANDVSLIFRAANGLIFQPTLFSEIPNPFPIPGSDVEEIGIFDISSLGNYKGTFTYTPNQNYTQFQLYPIINNSDATAKEAYVTIKNIQITCHTSALTDFTTTPNDIQNNCGLTYDFTPILDHNGCTKDEKYVWLVDGVNSGSGQNFNYTFSAEGKHEVCLKYEDCYGCCAEICKEMQVKDCACTAPPGYIHLDAKDGRTLTQLLGLFPNNNTIPNPAWLVSGNLIIDNNITSIAGGKILMDDGAKITVNSNMLFRINGTTFEAGCDNMWKGIFFSGGGRNSINAAHIYDAETAINITGSPAVSLTNNFFDRNYTSVYASNSPKPLNKVNGNVFEFSTNAVMLPAYAGQQLYDGVRSQAGIIGFNTGTITLEGTLSPNYFRNMWNGILLDRSSLTCINNEFNDFSGFTTLFSNLASRGLPIKVTSGNTVEIRSNVIKNGHLGIALFDNNNTNIDIISNDEISGFNNLINSNGQIGSGILIRGGTASDINIKDNPIINNVANGINIQNLNFPSLVNVENNQIQAKSMGITAGNIIQFNGSLIRENQIEINPISDHTYQPIGIFISQAGFSNIRENEITLISTEGTGPSKLGISLTNSGFSTLEDNIVNGFLINNTGSIGYINNASGLCWYDCNKSNVGFEGFRFSNIPITNFSGISFVTNRMIDIGISNNPYGGGLTLANSALGPQNWNGNIWQGGNSRAAVIQNSNFLESIFKYNPGPVPAPYTTGTWKPDNTTPSSIENQWFLNLPGNPNATCIDPMQVSLPSVSDIEEIIGGDVLNNDYYDQNFWTAQLMVLELLKSNQSYLSQSNTLNQYYNGNAAINKYFNFENVLNDLSQATLSEMNQMTSYTSSLSQYQNDLAQILDQVNDNNYQSYATQINNISTQIENVKNDINSLSSLWSARAATNANTLKNQLSGLPEPFVFNENFKQVYEAKLDLFLEGGEYVVTNHGSTLQSVAELCPYEIGNPVFAARELCYDLGLTFVEDNDCSNNRLSSSSVMPKIETIQVYPSPSRDNIVVKCNQDIWQISILNLEGKAIKIYNILDQKKEIELDISDLPCGLYVMKLLDSKGSNLISKLIKQ